MKIFLILSGFQITWLSSIFGEYYNYPLLGFIVGILYLFIFFRFIKIKTNLLFLYLFFSIIGYTFDTILSYNNLYYFNSAFNVGYLPIWLLTLWLSFNTLLLSVLIFLRNRIILSFILGSILGPLSYYSGIPLNISYTTNIYLAFILMFFFWGLFMSLYSKVIEIYFNKL
ncbi:MAG: hypothetical protein CMI95_00415 [Pelagibacteraceae bacterium]|nr:hypothetical protein [Pelagibacteraceae bacterium]|tara:strand:+ start:498 stop:1007 length:510 start_codon:yes stop_codon:yes gene_type:complete